MEFIRKLFVVVPLQLPSYTALLQSGEESLFIYGIIRFRANKQNISVSTKYQVNELTIDKSNNRRISVKKMCLLPPA